MSYYEDLYLKVASLIDKNEIGSISLYLTE